MPANSGTGLEATVAKLGKEVIWLRVAVIVALVMLALVAVAMHQLRAPVSELAETQASPATATFKAARFLVVDAKGRVRGEFGLDKDAASIEILDADGKVLWRMPETPPPPVEPAAGAKESKE